MRENIDPFNKYSNEEIIKALEEANVTSLFSIVNGNHHTTDLNDCLNMNIKTELKIQSASDIQKILLAKAFLNKGKILIFDESTSTINSNANIQIQDKILSHFRSSTVITISHDFKNFISKCDR